MKNINYSDLMEITVRSQKELDAIPLDFKGRIYVRCSSEDWLRIEHSYHFSVEVCGSSSVMAFDDASIVVYDNSSVEAYGNAEVVAWDNTRVEAYENSSVVAYGNSFIEAFDDSFIDANESSSVIANEYASIKANDNVSVVAYGHSFVRAWDNASVVARGHSYVEANDNASVTAYGSSFVKANEDSSIEAWENAYVEARESSSVKAYGNVQVINFLQKAKIKTYGNARVVYNPKTIHEFLDFYNIKHNEKTAKFYKAVHKKENVYFSDYNNDFIYKIGATVKEECDPNVEEDCSKGIHVSTLDWALVFGENWGDLAILELKVDIDKIILPSYSYGKVRTSEAKVLREIPLEKCGLYGKILAKRKVRK